MSKFTPVDEKEYSARNVWPAGWYAAEIIESVERLSQNGNLMFETKFQVFNDDGKHRLITGYVMVDGKAAFQMRACAEAFGVLDQYKAGTLSEDDLVGKSGYVKLIVQTDSDGKYPDANKIADYCKSMPGTITAKDVVKKPPMTKQETQDTLGESEIPF